MGGVLPPMAAKLHKQSIENVVIEALEKANVELKDLDAIATAVQPGIPLCLDVGLEHTKHLLQKTKRPFIPIHHMQAHALTARMVASVEFPFLVLLMSGGHCLLAVARDVEDFVILGNCHNRAPGEFLDKIARKLKIKNIEEYSEMSGGRAIEILARKGDPKSYELMCAKNQAPDCNFSFSGHKRAYDILIDKLEAKHDIRGGNTLPNLSDICANIQYSVAWQLTKRLQRAFHFCYNNNLLPTTNRQLVVSGGVASNAFFRECLSNVCSQHECQLVCPPPKLCTDNGIMIAWNGIEKMRTGKNCFKDIDTVNVQHRCPLGEDWSERVAESAIKVRSIKFLPET